MQCQFEGCNKTLPEQTGKGGKQKYCPRHAAKVNEANMNKAREKYLKKKKAEKLAGVTKPKVCGNCGVEIPRSRYFCDPCRDTKARVRRAEYAKAKRSLLKTGPVHIGFKKVDKPIIPQEDLDRIDAQKRLQDLEFDRRLAAKCGYGHSDVKVLSAAEIAAIAHTLTPPHVYKDTLPFPLRAQEGR